MKASYLDYMSNTDYGKRAQRELQHIFCGRTGDGYEEMMDALVLEVWKAGYNSGIADMKKALEKLPDSIPTSLGNH